MNSAAALRFLYSRHPLRWKLGLERIQAFLQEIDNPQLTFRAVQVAGTNGKGSVCTYLAQICAQEGFRVGLYTSPHLCDFRERIQILGEYQVEQKKNLSGDVIPWTLKGARVVSYAYISSWVDTYQDSICKHQLSYFECVTAMAFCYFRDQEVDYAVLETGLGGRLDAVTAAQPELTAITTLGKDHTQYLGETLEQILEEKCGILKPGVPLVYRPLNAPLEARLLRAAQLKGVKAIRMEENKLRVSSNQQALWLSNLGLRGIQAPFLDFPSQKESLIQALHLWEACSLSKEKQALKPDNTLAPLSHWFFESPPARLQYFSGPNYAPLLADAAHNVDGVQALIKLLKEKFSRPSIHWLVTSMPDKNQEGLMALWEMYGFQHTWVHLIEEPRYRQPPQKLLHQMQQKGWKFIVFNSSHTESLESFYKKIPRDHLLVVCGSFYLLGSVLEPLIKLQQK